MASSTSVSGLIKWLGKDPWRDAFLGVLNEHVGSALDDLGLSQFDDLASLIDAHWTMTVWGCAFEDFLTREILGAGYMIDDYLKRRGWKESARNKAYIAALKNSVMSLYEVSEIKPGESFLARDLIRGGEPVLISERSATTTIRPWDRLALRIVELPGKKVIGGGLLPIDPDKSELLLRALEDEAGSDPVRVDELAPLFSRIFLESMIERVIDPDEPVMVNSEGGAIEFIRIVFRLTDQEAHSAVRKALDRSLELEAVASDQWNWIERQKPAGKSSPSKEQGDLAWVTTSSSGGLVLGNLELKARTIEMSVNSQERAERGQQVLAELLKGLVGFPLMERQTLEQALNEQSEAPTSDAELPNIDPEERCRIIHEAMDRHYREQLDEPIPALDGLSPRTASKSDNGRQKLETWLKRLENQNARHESDDPMSSYDTTWLWEELGMTDRRK
jgi:hypothetical protein